MHNATVSAATNRRAWKLAPKLLALALATVVVGLGIVATIGRGKSGPSRTADTSTKPALLSQRQILLLGHGPLTQRAAQDLISAGRGVRRR
jgi:hypothetical protein